MLNKRIIFTLLWDGDSFVLSRNFRLQRVGGVDWLLRNYNFEYISTFIDELVLLDVSRRHPKPDSFGQVLQSIAAHCFIPIAAGGGVRSLDTARNLLRAGADKIVINSPLFEDTLLVRRLSQEFGQQSIVGSVDIKLNDSGNYHIYTKCGTSLIRETPSNALLRLSDQMVGEIYLNSINQDGTGQGYDLQLIDLIPPVSQIPIIIAGGAGNAFHLAEGLADPRVSAVATAHLFNFIGDGLQRAREYLLGERNDLASWPLMSELLISFA